MPFLHPIPRAASFTAILHLFSQLKNCFQIHRVWGPQQVLLTVFAMMEPGRAASYQLACKIAMLWGGDHFGWQSVPNPSGFGRGRERVEESDCVRLFEGAKQLAGVGLHKKKELVCGLLPTGIDGTILHMPRGKELIEKFEIPHGCHYPDAWCVTVGDLVRRIPLAWVLDGYKTSERHLFLSILNQLPSNALCILDRGYPSKTVFGAILDSGRHFVARMVASEGACWNEVAAFLASGAHDAIVSVEVGEGKTRRIAKLRMILREYDPSRKSEFTKHETMVIITSVLDPKLKKRDIIRLYGARWGIETIYREMKAVAKIEQWHGKTIKLVRQELILLLVWFCFASLFSQKADKTRLPTKESDAIWRTNTRRVFEAIFQTIHLLFSTGNRHTEIIAELARHADAALDAMCRWMQRIREGRSYSRIPMHPYARKI